MSVSPDTGLTIDRDLLRRLEHGLDPARPSESEVPFSVIGYGEISTVFQIPGDGELAYKRMPLFESVAHAERYVESFREYSGLLEDAGIRLPPQATTIIDVPGRPVVLYIAQPLLDPVRFCHAMIRSAKGSAAREIVQSTVREVGKVWEWNRTHSPSRELSLDGQLSNWVMADDGRPYYVDTSTPMYRIDGVEQLDAELFLRSAPAALRWVLRLFFVDDVLTRYYDLHQVLRDLAANLYKEGRADLVSIAVQEINRFQGKRAADAVRAGEQGETTADDAADSPPALTVAETDKYYSQDKVIWRVYLAFRRLDRFITSFVFRGRYEFLLPGKIKR